MKHICLKIRLWAAAESGGLQDTSSHTHAYAVMIVHGDDGATSKIVGIQRLPNGGGIFISLNSTDAIIKIIITLIMCLH